MPRQRMLRNFNNDIDNLTMAEPLTAIEGLAAGEIVL